MPHRSSSLGLVPVLLLVLLGLGPSLAWVSGCSETAARVEEGEAEARLSAEPQQALVGSLVRFDAGASQDGAGVEARFSDSAFHRFHFDFGDGYEADGESFVVDHSYESAGDFVVAVTVVEEGSSDTAQRTVTIRHPAPAVSQIDVSGDDVAVIGEWIALRGRAFREANEPKVSFDAVSATGYRFLDENTWEVQVPPRVASGLCVLAVDFPAEDDGDASFEIWVTRYALATDAFQGVAYLVEFGEGSTAWPRSQSVELSNAAVVRMSGDGSFALLGDARFQATLRPSVLVVDMAADWQPVVVAEIADLGLGPLFDIAIAHEAPRAVLVDATGFTVLDLADPTLPVVVGDRVSFDFGDMAPTAASLSGDGSVLALLSTFNDRARFYSLSDEGFGTYESWSVDVGPSTQDAALIPGSDTWVVLGGGGEGAIPPDLALGNSSLTRVDLDSHPPSNPQGDGAFHYLGDEVPLPVDLGVGPEGRVVVSTLDSNFGTVLEALGDLAGNPGDIGAWQDLIESMSGLGFGAVVPIDGLVEGEVHLGEGLFSPFGFQAGVDLRYDEEVYVATTIGLGTTLEFLTGDELVHLSLDLDYGVSVGNLSTGEVVDFAFYTQGIVSYVDFVLDYDLEPLTALLLPPYAFGDVAIQP